MSINTTLQKLILATALIAVTAMAQTPYDDGQKALREQNWTQASELFNQAIKEDRDNADASMYWRAYALYKAGRDKEAERQIRSLEKKYSSSRWLKEAQVLEIENSGSSALTQAGDNKLLDEDLRMFALAQLMDRDPDRALPLVLELLEGSSSADVRKDTLFMLGMSDDPRAQKAIADFARDSTNPQLQASAIQMLGISGSQPSIDLLASLYRESDSNDVKRAVIEAYMIADESDELVKILTDLLKQEDNPELQNDIIHTLGVMDATDELKALYPTLTSQASKVATLKAFFMAEDIQTLRNVLDSETNSELRATAIQGIAIAGGKGASELLESAYQVATSTAEKKIIVEALVMMDDGQDLAMKVILEESDRDLRKTAIQALGIMEANSAMAELYSSLDDVELRKSVLESMAIADDSAALVGILQTEKEPELRAVAIQAMAITGDDEAGKHLVGLYPIASRDEKQAIIQSMMIMDDAESLLGLMKVETDPELKRSMLQTLTMMGSDAVDDYLFELLEEQK